MRRFNENRTYSFEKNKTIIHVTDGHFYQHKTPKHVWSLVGSFDTKYNNIEGYDIFELTKGQIEWLRSIGIDPKNVYGYVTHFDQEGMVKIDWDKLKVRFLETKNFQNVLSRPVKMTALRLEYEYEHLLD